MSCECHVNLENKSSVSDECTCVNLEQGFSTGVPRGVAKGSTRNRALKT